LRNGAFFPERIRRRDVLLKDAIAVFQRDHVEGRLRNAKHYVRTAVVVGARSETRALRQIVPGDVARYITRRQQDGMAPATINRELAFLKRFYNRRSVTGSRTRTRSRASDCSRRTTPVSAS